MPGPPGKPVQLRRTRRISAMPLKNHPASRLSGTYDATRLLREWSYHIAVISRLLLDPVAKPRGPAGAQATPAFYPITACTPAAYICLAKSSHAFTSCLLKPGSTPANPMSHICNGGPNRSRASVRRRWPCLLVIACTTFPVVRTIAEAGGPTGGASTGGEETLVFGSCSDCWLMPQIMRSQAQASRSASIGFGQVRWREVSGRVRQ